MNTPEEQFESPAETGATLAASAPDTPLSARARMLAKRWPGVAVAAALLLLAGLVLVVYSLVTGDRRPLYPNLPTFTPVAAVVTGEPALLTFTELNADPAAYRNQRIQVSGNYASIAPPACGQYSGPPIRWSLVSEDLQLNATGFENILRLVREGTPMTVTGIWRLYEGPAGCGKEPPDATVWYLAVDQIIEPNPLYGGNGIALTVVAGSPLPTLPPLDLEPPTPTPTFTLPATDVISETATLPATPTFPLLVTPALSATVTPTPTATATGEGTLPPPGTPTLTGTPGPSPTPAGTQAPGETPSPGLPTATLSGTGYPPPTATTEGYP